ncbi:TpHN family protein [Theileria parva strain Muguga]|uniref:Tash1 protein, putative n=1 Tax=Theileria parva TaxID=5875 RepID=Q4N852_THEPA|nr:uncharacterized protein TpMuguga_01g00618 [Theileria parva strain Muguga]EAN33856.1 TpHN family protein [Theileria parva strain Muguga]|eukprot:XP_766139.1 hypothetical protein [Theileria parva strain Muguga]
MATLKLSHVLFTLFLYHIKIVFSNLLDLDNIAGSGYNIVQTSERGITKLMIFSTQEKKITVIYNKEKLIWKGHPGEYTKCFTIYKFEMSNIGLASLEILNPEFENIKYFRSHNLIYKPINQETFEAQLEELTKYSNEFSTTGPRPSGQKPPILSERIPGHPRPGKVPATRKKRKPTSSYNYGKRRKRGLIKEAQTETDSSKAAEQIKTKPIDSGNLEPEHVSVALSSDDDDEPTKEQTSQLIRQKLREKIQKKQLKAEVFEKLKKKIKDKSQETKTVSETETDSSTKPKSKPLEPEIIESQSSSDSDMDVDESTGPQVIQSDATTQTDTHESQNSETQTVIQTSSTETQTKTQNDDRGPSTLPIKKRPYKPD